MEHVLLIRPYPKKIGTRRHTAITIIIDTNKFGASWKSFIDIHVPTFIYLGSPQRVRPSNAKPAVPQLPIEDHPSRTCYSRHFPQQNNPDTVTALPLRHSNNPLYQTIQRTRLITINNATTVDENRAIRTI